MRLSQISVPVIAEVAVKEEAPESQLGKVTSSFGAAIPQSTSAARSAPAAATSKGVVLVVDDEKSVRLFTERMLQRAGYKVCTAANGPDGLEVFQQHVNEIKAVLLDLTLGGMDGLETMRRLHKMEPNVPVVIMSGYGQADVAERFSGMGVAGFIEKPFNMGDFLLTVSGVVDAGKVKRKVV